MDITEEFLQDKRKEEYQYQLFQFNSPIFKNELKDMALSVIEDAVGKMENSLIGKYSTKTDVIRSACRKLIEEYTRVTHDWVSSFEGKLESMFIGIPSHVLLPDDKPQVKQYSKERMEKVLEELAHLEKMLKQQSFMKAKMKKALETSESCKESVTKLKETISNARQSKEFLEPTNKLLSDIKKIDEGDSYISEKLADNISETDELSSLQEPNLKRKEGI